MAKLNLNQINEGSGGNLLINPQMLIWQRGTSHTINGYSADQWLLEFSGTVSGVQHTNVSKPQTPTTFSYLLDVNAQDAASGYAQIRQRMEDVFRFSGRTVTLSFDVFANNATNPKVLPRLYGAYGTGGSTGWELMPDEPIPLVGGQWEHISYTFEQCPDMSSVTLGSTTPYVALILMVTAGTAHTTYSALGTTTGDYYFTNVKLEYGPVETPFQARPRAIEYDLCRRYYESMTFSYKACAAQSATIGYTDMDWKVRKMGVPTITNLTPITYYDGINGWQTATSTTYSASADKAVMTLGGASMAARSVVILNGTIAIESVL